MRQQKGLENDQQASRQAQSDAEIERTPGAPPFPNR
ncbi:hypothetical protein GGI1_06270 [Acidithiobacillus sp. GGI-221]|nr:hypothetical protein GGI1_06270 [Acidithiobacillus sp. GGI-221]